MEIPGSSPQVGVMTASNALPWILWMASSSCFAQTLVIRLYDYADLSAVETVRLTQAAGQAFGHAGIHVAWLRCSGVMTAELAAACERKIESNEIMVRLHPSGPRGSHDRMVPLGCAMITAKGGHYATVYVPVVRALAADLGLEFDLLMGYVVAHEVGHCLLGPGHSYVGLMQATWSRKDVGALARLSVHLTKQEARKAAARLAAAQPSAGRD
jgi:hypothetical protein